MTTLLIIQQCRRQSARTKICFPYQLICCSQVFLSGAWTKNSNTLNLKQPWSLCLCDGVAGAQEEGQWSGDLWFSPWHMDSACFCKSLCKLGEKRGTGQVRSRYVWKEGYKCSSIYHVMWFLKCWKYSVTTRLDILGRFGGDQNGGKRGLKVSLKNTPADGMNGVSCCFYWVAKNMLSSCKQS